MIRLSKADVARLGLRTTTTAKRGPNKLEARYGAYLATLKVVGEIIDYGFEEIKLKIGVKTCWFTADFWVLTTDGLAFHECKGFMRDDALVKIKAAALKYPQFKFVLVRLLAGRWEFEVVA